MYVDLSKERPVFEVKIKVIENDLQDITEVQNKVYCVQNGSRMRLSHLLLSTSSIFSFNLYYVQDLNYHGAEKGRKTWKTESI